MVRCLSSKQEIGVRFPAGTLRISYGECRDKSFSVKLLCVASYTENEMRILAIFMLLLSVCACTTSDVQGQNDSGWLSYESGFNTRIYLARDPVGTVLYLHGNGQRRQGANPSRGPGPQMFSNQGFNVIVPHNTGPFGWPKAKLDDCVAAGVTKLGSRFDSSKFYLTGQSMGGIGTLQYAVATPEKWAAIVPVAAALDYPTYNQANVNQAAQKLKDIPTWFHHGRNDSTVKYAHAQGMAEALEAAGGEVEFTTYQKGHNIWQEAYQPRVANWLKTKTLSQPDPDPDPDPDPEPTPDVGKWIVLQSLDQRRNRIRDNVLSQVDTLGIRVSLSRMETDAGLFQVQEDLNRCKRLQKTATLTVFGGIHSPQRLKTGQTSRGTWNSGEGTYPVPWREDYQNTYRAVLENIAKLNNTNIITHIHIPGPHGAEWHFKRSDIYQRYGNSNASRRLRDAQVALGVMIGEIFPSVQVVVSVGDNNQWTFQAEDRLRAQLGNRVALCNHALSAKINTSWINYTRIRDWAGPKGFEMLSPSNQPRFGGSFQQAIQKGDRANADWYRVYQGDIGLIE